MEDRGRCNEWKNNGHERSGSVLLQSWSKTGTKSVKSSGDMRHGQKWRRRMMGRRMSPGEFVDEVLETGEVAQDVVIWGCSG